MTIAKIFSTLGNTKSLVPLAVKDSANCMGMTAASSVTSKDEGKDRFIDEVGTEIIWIGGIPLFKKGIDKTLFKAAKYDAKYDVRNLKNNDIFEKTKAWAPTEEIKENIEKIGNNKKTFKNLNLAKFAIATVMTLGVYNIMTDLKQKYTHNKIKAKILKENEQNALSKMFDKKAAFDKDAKYENLSTLRSYNKNNSPSFKGIYDVMLDPVKNTLVLDAGITSERLTKARSPQEFTGYAIKEGGFLFFMYYLGQKIQNYFEKTADKKHNRNISLDARVIEDDKFKQSFADKSVEKGLKEFEKFQKIGTDLELYDFINQNPDNIVVKTAKQSDIIETYKEPKKWYQVFEKSVDTGKVDTRKYIDLDEVRNTHKNISKLYNQFNESGKSADEFFKSVKKLKRGSIAKNIGSTIFALGVVLPSIMLADRLLKPDNKEFAVEKEIKAQIAQNT